MPITAISHPSRSSSRGFGSFLTQTVDAYEFQVPGSHGVFLSHPAHLLHCLGLLLCHSLEFPRAADWDSVGLLLLVWDNCGVLLVVWDSCGVLLLIWDSWGAPLACLLSLMHHCYFFVILRFSVIQTASVYYFNYNGISGPHDSILDQSRNVLPLILDLHANYVIHKSTSKREIWKIYRKGKKTSKKITNKVGK